jgi:hypothetical protein
MKINGEKVTTSKLPDGTWIAEAGTLQAYGYATRKKAIEALKLLVKTRK